MEKIYEALPFLASLMFRLFLSLGSRHAIRQALAGTPGSDELGLNDEGALSICAEHVSHALQKLTLPLTFLSTIFAGILFGFREKAMPEAVLAFFVALIVGGGLTTYLLTMEQGSLNQRAVSWLPLKRGWIILIGISLLDVAFLVVIFSK